MTHTCAESPGRGKPSAHSPYFLTHPFNPLVKKQSVWDYLRSTHEGHCAQRDEGQGQVIFGF